MNTAVWMAGMHPVRMVGDIPVGKTYLGKVYTDKGTEPRENKELWKQRQVGKNVKDMEMGIKGNRLRTEGRVL